MAPRCASFVEPEAVLDIEAFLEHEGSGYAVTKAKITSNGKKVCDAQLKLRTDAVCRGAACRYRAQARERGRAWRRFELARDRQEEDRMSKANNDVVITGVGIVTCHGCRQGGACRASRPPMCAA
jgi:hypothetical protein